MSEKEKRILVLGSSDHGAATAYDWPAIPDDLSVADFDIVLIDLESCSLEDLEVSATALSDRWQQFARLFFSSQSEVIVIGSPIRTVPNGVGVSAARWLPSFPACRAESGTVISNVDPEFSYYFSNISSYKYHFEQTLTQVHQTGEYARVVHQEGNSVLAEVKCLALTRFDRAIAVELHYFILNSKGARLQDSGKVIWLPPPTSNTVHASFDQILATRFGILASAAAPSWIVDYKLPNQIPIESQIKVINTDIADLERKLVSSKEALVVETRFQMLLYEQGTGLEPLVREALSVLGASVDAPVQAGHEDGRFTDPFGRMGMLEVKSSAGSIKLRDVRQLDHWVREAMAEEDWDGKGLLIANTFRERNPGEREQSFPDNCVRAAERFGCALLTTTALFRAICDLQNGLFESRTFWDVVFASSGICPLPEVVSGVSMTAN